jgi:predicted kinase
MPSVTILSGAPGTGKTTVAARLARSSVRGAHIQADLFFGFPASPIPPHLPAAQEQNATIMVALARTAAAFATRGYDVFLDGIFGPWFMPLLRAELADAAVDVHYVVLRAPLDICLQRVRGRRDQSDEAMVRKMHAELDELGAYTRHAVAASDLAAEQVADEITRRLRIGELRLVPS